jgi:predicted methyltransferase
MLAILMRSARLVFALPLVAACGGSAPAAVPPHLDIPVPPEAKAGRAGRSAAALEAAPPPPMRGPEPVHPTATHAPVPPAVQALIDAKDRAPEDRALDAGRRPGELLAFLALRPGDKVADLSAAGGYTTELLSRAVGPQGRVWAQNNALYAKYAGAALGERLKKPTLKNVVRVDRELDSPLPPDAKNLDAVIDVLAYHDSLWMGVDRDKMNKAIFDALRHGGQYVVVDHSAPEGSGGRDAKTTHRIDELFVIHDVERAGFHHVTTADFLRNPTDTRDWNDSPEAAGDRRGTSDRFVLKFVRP